MDKSSSLPAPWQRNAVSGAAGPAPASSPPAPRSAQWPASRSAHSPGHWPGAATHKQPAADANPLPDAEQMVRTAHELRAPATAMLGLAELMASDPHAPVHERHAGYLQHLMAAGRHLVALIDELTDLSLLQSGRLQTVQEAVDLHQLAGEACGCAAPAAQARRVQVALRRTPQASVARADRRRCLQVLNNLLANAIRYNREGGRLEVCVGPGPCISVADTGPGLDATQLAQLFEPFNRLGRDAEPVRGTGVGLALSHELMQHMGGSLLVSSTPGVGTTVTMALPAECSSGTQQGPDPASAAEVAALPAPAAGSAANDAPWLLCIDDNPVNAMLLQEWFNHQGNYRVRVAETGQDGLALARAGQPVAVLLDLWLPDMDGCEVLRQLRSDPATQDIPVAIVSGTVNRAELQQALDLGAQACWPKPLDLTQVDDLLAALLRPHPAHA